MAIGPIPSVSLTRGTQSLTLNWSVNWNGSTLPRSVSVSLALKSGGSAVYTSSLETGTNVAVTGLQGGKEYRLTITATGFVSSIGESVATTVTYDAFTSAITVWNGSTFVPVTATKVWNGTSFVNASAVKSNSAAGSTPTWGTIG